MGKRWATVLAASLLLNLTVLALFLYDWREGGLVLLSHCSFGLPREIPISVAPASSLQEALLGLRTKPYPELLALLQQESPRVEGFAPRDLSLAILATVHDLDVERALSAFSIQRRALRLPDVGRVMLYPALGREHYEVILRFLRTEKWPLTARGLFLRLQGQHVAGRPLDASLKEAFLRTNEYLCVATLLNRGTVHVVGDPLPLMLDGSWQAIAELFHRQEQVQDYSSEQRRLFLTRLFKGSSARAAHLLALSEPEFVQRNFDDDEAILFLKLLQERPEIGAEYALYWLEKPRSDALWQQAAKLLVRVARPPVSTPITRKALLSRFGKNVSAKMPISPPPPDKGVGKEMGSQETSYMVQPGDSLWKIARKFGVDTPTLRAYNKLPSDVLKPGSRLKIPPPAAN